MLKPYRIRAIANRLSKFVSVPHEGLGEDAQQIMIKGCEVIKQLAKDIENSSLMPKTTKRRRRK